LLVIQLLLVIQRCYNPFQVCNLNRSRIAVECI
jgi:hypothetical protein